MANRHADWFRQAEADLRHARHALEDGDYELSDAESILEFCRGSLG